MLVLAFAPYEARPLLAAGQLFRGMAIQLAHQWGAGRLLADDADRAVLLWSASGPRQRQDARQEVLSVAAAVLTGVVLFVASNTLLLLPLAAALQVIGVPAPTILDVQLSVVMVRLAVTLWRAVYAYLHHRRLMAQLPVQVGPRWGLELLAASPQGRGHGRHLLQRFLDGADRADAEVVLHCDMRNVAFYRHHGFRIVTDVDQGDQLLMVRPSGSVRRHRARDRARHQLQGHLRKGGTATRTQERAPATAQSC